MLRNEGVSVSNNQPSSAELSRVGKFGLVGVLNTFIDFGCYNLLSSLVGLNLVQSNIISTSVAMTISFLANRRLVFKKRHTPMLKQAVLFFVVTAFGMYILQTGTIKILTEIWLTPVGLVLGMAHALNIWGYDGFLAKNSAKVIATLLSLTWNYIMYKKVVFS